MCGLYKKCYFYETILLAKNQTMAKKYRVLAKNYNAKFIFLVKVRLTRTVKG